MSRYDDDRPEVRDQSGGREEGEGQEGQLDKQQASSSSSKQRGQRGTCTPDPRCERLDKGERTLSCPLDGVRGRRKGLDALTSSIAIVPAVTSGMAASTPRTDADGRLADVTACLPIGEKHPRLRFVCIA